MSYFLSAPASVLDFSLFLCGRPRVCRSPHAFLVMVCVFVRPHTASNISAIFSIIHRQQLPLSLIICEYAFWSFHSVLCGSIILLVLWQNDLTTMEPSPQDTITSLGEKLNEHEHVFYRVTLNREILLQKVGEFGGMMQFTCAQTQPLHLQPFTPLLRLLHLLYWSLLRKHCTHLNPSPMNCKKPLISLNGDGWSLIQMTWRHMLHSLTILKVCLLKELVRMRYWLKDQMGEKSTSRCFLSWPDKPDEMWVGCKRLASHLWPTCVYNLSHHPLKVRSPERTWCVKFTCHPGVQRTVSFLQRLCIRYCFEF